MNHGYWYFETVHKEKTESCWQAEINSGANGKWPVLLITKHILPMTTLSLDNLKKLNDTSSASRVAYPLTGKGQTLRLVPNIMWIVVEDHERPTEKITRLLQRSCVHFTHLAAKSRDFPEMYHVKGGIQRNKGLQWLRDLKQHQPKLDGVMYFADDDNAYDVKLFEYIRRVQTVGVWPVGFAGGLLVETPKVLNQKVVGWRPRYKPNRSFAIDMAGFAVNLQLLIDKPMAQFHEQCLKGQIETCFLEQLHVTRNSLQPFGFEEEPQDIFVWHTGTKKTRNTHGGSNGFIVT